VIVVVADEEGHEEFLTQTEDNTPPRQVDGVLTGRARFALGALAPGAYTLRASVEDGTEAVGDLLVTDGIQQAQGEPDTAATETTQPEAAEPKITAPGAEVISEIGRPEYQGRNWGISAALYAIRSTHAWGVGDFGDLADLAVTAANAGADYVLLTPLA